jgi:hypothetical protein
MNPEEEKKRSVVGVVEDSAGRAARYGQKS